MSLLALKVRSYSLADKAFSKPRETFILRPYRSKRGFLEIDSPIQDCLLVLGARSLGRDLRLLGRVGRE